MGKTTTMLKDSTIRTTWKTTVRWCSIRPTWAGTACVAVLWTYHASLVTIREPSVTEARKTTQSSLMLSMLLVAEATLVEPIISVKALSLIRLASVGALLRGMQHRRFRLSQKTRMALTETWTPACKRWRPTIRTSWICCTLATTNWTTCSMIGLKLRQSGKSKASSSKS